jgi:hypothetical protein
MNRSYFENKQPFPCLGVGTKGFSDNSKHGLKKSRMGGYIEKSDAVAEDNFQVAMTLLRYFNKPTSGDWQERAVSAANDGIDAMTNFLLSGKTNEGGGPDVVELGARMIVMCCVAGSVPTGCPRGILGLLS